jgi:hypothetical protein
MIGEINENYKERFTADCFPELTKIKSKKYLNKFILKLINFSLFNEFDTVFKITHRGVILI